MRLPAIVAACACLGLSLAGCASLQTAQTNVDGFLAQTVPTFCASLPQLEASLAAVMAANRFGPKTTSNLSAAVSAANTMCASGGVGITTVTALPVMTAVYVSVMTAIANPRSAAVAQ